MPLTIDEIVGVFSISGHIAYDGEPVSQLEHALQTAALADAASATAALIAASLLHDLGHLLNDRDATLTARGIDDAHQHLVIRFLRGRFDKSVLAPIGLHVDAKRYLCAVEPGYFDTLSKDSKRSLQLQGGLFSKHEARAFIARPYALDAVQLRRWDDRAKVAGYATPPLSRFVETLYAASSRR